MRVLIQFLFLALCGWWPMQALAVPAAGTRDLCTAAILQAERVEGIPDRLLLAVAMAESGRWDKATRQGYAWPWTVTNGGAGSFFADQETAMQRVQDLRSAGESNIDVGCMQVNLRAHPAAFPNLPAAFDPVSNARYAARFLRQLYDETGEWSRAVAYYHSRTPEKGAAYRDRVYARLDKLTPLNQLAALPAPMAPADATVAQDVMTIWHWLRAGAKGPLVAQVDPQPAREVSAGESGAVKPRPLAAGGIAVGRLLIIPARAFAAD